MRHDQLAARHTYDKVDIAAATDPAEMVRLRLVEPLGNATAAADTFKPTPAAPDVPVGVGRLIVAAYGGLIASFAVVTAESGESVFMIAIAAMFVVAFFTVPRIILGQEPKVGRRPTLERFLADGMETLTGHNGGAAVLVQMLIVPVLLTFAVLAIGIATSIAS